MADEFYGQNSVTTPALKMWNITPHDTNPISPIPKALRFNAAGQVTLRALQSDSDVTITVAAGEVLDVRALYIRDTNTDAIAIHGLG